MAGFSGFPEKGEDSIPVPGVFFTDILPSIDNLDELRISLFVFWNINGQVQEPRYIRFSDLFKDERLATCFGDSRQEQEKRLADALRSACERGTLLTADLDEESFYFLNTERGRAVRAPEISPGPGPKARR